MFSNSIFNRYDEWYKLAIDTAGCFVVYGKELEAHGFKTGIKSNLIHIFAIGEHSVNTYYPDTMIEIPILVVDGGDGVFGENDYIIFYGVGPSAYSDDDKFNSNPYVKYYYYWLTYGRNQGKRFKAYKDKGGPKFTYSVNEYVHSEEDRINPGRSGLLWVEEELLKQTGQESITYSKLININGLDSVKKVIFGFYDTSRSEVIMTVNGKADSFTNLYTNNIKRFIEITDIPYNKERINIEIILKNLEQETSAAMLFIDDWDIYARINLLGKAFPIRIKVDTAKILVFKNINSSPLFLDIKNPYSPSLLYGWHISNDTLYLPADSGRYIYATDRNHFKKVKRIERLKTSYVEDFEADYIVIAPEGNYLGANAFVNYRQNHFSLPEVQNPQVKLVKLDDIYNFFGFGLKEPGVIKKFLKYVYNKYNQRLKMVLFVGEGSYDYRNILGLVDEKVSFPIYTTGYVLDANVTQTSSAAVDMWFVDFDTDTVSQVLYPEVIPARITSRGNTEVIRYLEKIKRYEKNTLSDGNDRLILTGDDFYIGYPKIDYIKDHINNCEKVYKELYPLFKPSKIYLTEYPLDKSEKPEARKALIDSLNRGGIFWIYFGHGKADQLAHEKVFMLDDVYKLSNRENLFYAFFGSCGLGRFEDTKEECISEELLRINDGAIASTGATKGLSNYQSIVFMDRFNEVYLDSTRYPVGYSFLAGVSGVSNLFVLFGDPSLYIKRPELRKQVSFTPSLNKGDSVSIQDSLETEGNYRIEVFSSEIFRHLSTPTGGDYYYWLPGKLLYRGEGAFTMNYKINFNLPLDVDYGKRAWIRLFMHTENNDMLDIYDSLTIDTIFHPISDFTGPEINIHVNGTQINNNDTIECGKQFSIAGDLFDTSGILLTGGRSRAGHTMGLEIVSKNEFIPLTNVFNYYANSSTRGFFRMNLTLNTSIDEIKITTIDNYLNESSLNFYVKTSNAQELCVSQYYMYPNPVSNGANIYFKTNTRASVSVYIYTIKGRLIKRILARQAKAGVNKIYWDGKDGDGRKVSNGVYYYTLVVRSGEDKVSVSSKFIVVR